MTGRTRPWRARCAAVLAILLCGAAIAACNRVVDLTPPFDAVPPDADITVPDDAGSGSGGFHDGGVDDGGALPDAVPPDA